MNAYSRSGVDIYRYGQHPEIPNPGDLLLVSTLEAAGHDGSIQFKLHIRGKDLQAFAKVFADASVEYVQAVADDWWSFKPDPELAAMAEEARQRAAAAEARDTRPSRRSSRTRAS